MNQPATAKPPRLIVPDLARGLALLGIAMANAAQAWMINDYDFAGDPGWSLGGVRPGSVADQIGAVFSAMFVHVRGLPMFSTLLGFGIGLIAASLWRKGYPTQAARGVLLRRYGFLALFGLVHMFGLFYGDIMATYGLIGVLAATMFTLSNKWLRVISYVLLIGSGILGSFGAVAGYFFKAEIPTELSQTPIDQYASFADYWLENALGGLFMLASIPFAALQLGGLVLIGYIWAREGYLVNVDQHKRVLWTWVIITAVIVLGIGLPWGLAAIGAINPLLEMPLMMLNLSWGLFTGPGILAALALATNGIQKRMYAKADATGQAAPPAWTYPFVALGKRSMSGYLAQSFLFILLVMPFTLGIGLGSSVTGKLLVGLLVWGITLVAAAVMEHFNIPGPFEQLHRRVSYGPTRAVGAYTPPQLPNQLPPQPGPEGLRQSQ